MSNTINILSVIDVETILNNNLPAGTLNNPTLLGSYTQSDAFVYMITKSGYIDSTDKTRADSELTIDANIGDTIQWELTCPGAGLKHDAIIAAVSLGAGTSLSTPEATLVRRRIFETAGEPGYQILEQTDFTSNVLATGTTQYSIIFQIMDKNGNNQGYFSWDPFVKVAQ